jgi:DNA-binding transcriptional regulator WhiA
MPTGIYPRTKEHIEKIAMCHRGKHLSEEVKKKISEQAISSGRNKGVNNPFYGKKHTLETMTKIALVKNLNPKNILKRAIENNIKIEPTKDWGYFIGIVLGDGWVNKKGYSIEVGSTVPEIVDAFRDVCKLLNLPFKYVARNCKVRPKNKRGITIRCTVVSKKINGFLRNYKKPDFHWEIPQMVIENEDMLTGFMQGIFDAEGGVYLYKKGMCTIELSSKHESNLKQVQKYLYKEYYISSSIIDSQTRTAAKLCINEYTNRNEFKEQIGFRLKRKQDKLDCMTRKRKIYSTKTYLYVLMLLDRGFSTKEIIKRAKVEKHIIYAWRDGKIPPYIKTDEALEDLYGH